MDISFDLGSFIGSLLGVGVAYLIARYQISQSFNKQLQLEKELAVLNKNIETLESLKKTLNYLDCDFNEVSLKEYKRILGEIKFYNIYHYNEIDKKIIGKSKFQSICLALLYLIRNSETIDREFMKYFNEINLNLMISIAYLNDYFARRMSNDVFSDSDIEEYCKLGEESIKIPKIEIRA